MKQMKILMKYFAWNHKKFTKPLNFRKENKAGIKEFKVE